MPDSQEIKSTQITDLRSDQDISKQPITKDQEQPIIDSCKEAINSSSDLKAAIEKAKKQKSDQDMSSSTAPGNIKYDDEGIIKELFNNTDKIETLKGAYQGSKLFVIGAILLPLAPPLSTAVGVLAIVAGSALILSPLAEGALKTYQGQTKSKDQDQQNNTGPLILTREDIEEDLLLQKPSTDISQQSCQQTFPSIEGQEPPKI